RVSLLAPVVGPAVDPRSPTWVAELERLTRPGGRLASLLAATAEHPELSWVVDPRLVEVTSPTDGPAEPPTDEADGAGGDGASDAPGADAAPAGPAATAWSRQLLEAMTDRDVRLLPYGDADVVALAHAGARDQLATAVQRAHEVARTTDLPDTASDTIAWPAVPLPDLATAAFVGQGEARALLVGPGELAPSDVLTYTPSGRTTVATASGDVPVLVPDERLSTALATGWVTGTAPATQEGEPEAEGPTGAEPSTPTALTGAVAGQDLLAELAVITRERPDEARHVLLTVPRDWAPDPAVVSAQLAALAAAPWVHPEPVAALLGAPDDGEARGELPARTVDPTEITPGEIGALAGAVADRAAVAEMVEDPALLVAGLEAELLAPLSVAWRADPAGRAQVVAVSGALTQQLRDAVTVEPGPTYNVISRTGELPVRVRNSLDQPVTVTVSLQPSSRRLVADETVTVTVPARGEASALIAVHAISSADVTVGVTLRTPSGVLVDDRARFDVRVRADWEGIGTAVIGALLAIGLVLGLVRSIRRGRSVRRSAPVDVGPDALSPEEAAEQPDGRPQDVSVSSRTDDR
ncbi:MAG: hypothetical protein JWP95_376, partial [Actinotalea sp.]|nr:hypothetical protein [Actinotalea sp.]